MIDGKESVTLINNITHVIKNQDDPNGLNMSLLELAPITGRTHQLRLHLSTLQHPILGDTLYGLEDIMKLSTRMCLHALSITFKHPTLNTNMLITADGCDFL
jgi:tRNA pseudouridine32 synthase/23S rRNA pseudouridine746 synthase